MTRVLTLDERVTLLDQMNIDENVAWEKEHGGTVRGLPPYQTSGNLRECLRIWHGDKVDAVEYMHNWLDNVSVPRDQLGVRLAQLEANDPELYIQLQNYRCVSDGDIEQWLDDNNVPK